MELTNEQIVTKLLSEKSILKNKNNSSYISNPNYDLGAFLKNDKSAPSQYGIKYVFVK